jgi:D-alanyl-D-alanine carboxypeptidase
MLESANDAAVAIALHISDSVEDFSVLMNRKAKEIGLENTNFCNPSGLPNDDHFSTARDLSVLMSYCMENLDFAEISSTRTKSISAPNGKTRFLSNHNKLLRLYDPCCGGKTGYTKIAGRCLVSVAKKDGVTLICTTLGAPNDWNDHCSLFDFGFRMFSDQAVVNKGDLRFSIPVVGGSASQIIVDNSDSFSIPLREGEKIEITVEMSSFLYAPVNNGDQIGEAIVYLGDKEVSRLALAAKEDSAIREVKLSFWQKKWNKIKSWF